LKTTLRLSKTVKYVENSTIFFPETGKRGALKDKNYKISGFRENAFPEIFSGINRTKFNTPSITFIF
jgi:hypothetical protein